MFSVITKAHSPGLFHDAENKSGPIAVVAVPPAKSAVPKFVKDRALALKIVKEQVVPKRAIHGYGVIVTNAHSKCADIAEYDTHPNRKPGSRLELFHVGQEQGINHTGPVFTAPHNQNQNYRQPLHGGIISTPAGAVKEMEG